MLILLALHYFFLIFHALFTFFNLIGWAFKKTRKAHRFTMFFTLVSWSILGIWFGFGFCFCTHWHWLILEKLGKNNLPYSYITYLIQELTGIRITNESYVVFSTFVIFAFLLILTLVLWVLEKRKNLVRKN